VKKAVMALASIGLTTLVGHASPSEARQESARHVGTRLPRNVAILIFEGVQIIDFTGPYETFGHAYVAAQPEVFNIYTVAEKPGALTTAMGMSVNPKYSIDTAPKPEIMVIPGGDVASAMNSPSVMEWLRKSAIDAEIVMSVCNGAFILAKAGLLDGLEATTTAFLIERLRNEAPRTRVVSDKRFVDNGKIITTAGLSSGIDGSLHVLERLFGRGTAEMAALGMEYNWDPASKYARAALADKYMPSQYDVESITTSWVPLSRRGDMDHWESKWSVESGAQPAEVLEHIENAFTNSSSFPRARNMTWEKERDDKSAGQVKSFWRFKDERGELWKGTASVEPVPGEHNAYIVSVAVECLFEKGRGLVR
jgi:putative intracellular protease/amidase